MTLNEYQEKAMTTCMPTCDNVSYMLLNLVAEVGELAGKIAKDIRKKNVEIGGGHYTKNELIPNMSFAEWTYRQDEYMKEAGDVLWQLAGFCKVMDWTLEDVAQGNLDKLSSRHTRGVIDGDGDNR